MFVGKKCILKSIPLDIITFNGTIRVDIFFNGIEIGDQSGGL